MERHYSHPGLFGFPTCLPLPLLEVLFCLLLASLSCFFTVLTLACAFSSLGFRRPVARQFQPTSILSSLG